MIRTNVGEWISVKEALPSVNKPVLTIDKYGYYDIGWMLKDKSWDSTSQCAYDVRHWMELPTKPNGRWISY